MCLQISESACIDQALQVLSRGFVVVIKVCLIRLRVVGLLDVLGLLRL